MKRKLTAALIAALPALALGQNVVVFGDSLSDTGQPGWALKASYLDANGQMHKLYDEHVAAALGSSLTASGSGGSNYAYRAAAWCWAATARSPPRSLTSPCNSKLRITPPKACALKACIFYGAAATIWPPFSSAPKVLPRPPHR